MRRVLSPAAIALVFLIGTGCTVLLAKIVPSHNQTFDASDIPSGRYILDHPHASIHFRTDHMGFSSFVGRFNSFDAALEFDKQRPEESKLGAIITTASIDSNSEELDEILRGREFFQVEKFPEITFTSDGIEITGEKSGILTGELTLLGVTNELRLDVTFNGGAYNMLNSRYTLGFSATGTLKRSDFGMSAYIPLIGDEVRFEIEAEFKRDK